MNYITTNIRLPEGDYLRLKNEALRKRTSLAAIIRKKISLKKDEDYAKRLLTIKGEWFTQKDHYQIKKEVEERLRKSSL